jgi:GT2 family glycosyltransferase
MDKVAVVIPNWNGEQLLGECLSSLHCQTLPGEVIVVDNGSRDGSVQLIEDYYPDVHILRLEDNYGFAGGVNAGIQYALKQGAEYIALLNNDTVTEADWLQRLVDTLEGDPESAIIASKQVETAGVIDSTGEEYSIWGTPFSRGRSEADKGQYDGGECHSILAASGAASLYRVDALNDIGLFDEWFFVYYEDVDISFRARLAGWRLRYAPEAIVYHHIGATSEKLGDFRLQHMYKNFPVVFIKNMPGKLFFKYGWRVGGVFGVKLMLLVLRFRYGLLLKVIGNVLWHLPRGFRQRRRVQQHRRVAPEDIDKLLYHAPPPLQPRLAKLVAKLPFN